MPSDIIFDDYSERYPEILNEGLSVTGEDGAYFARARIEWTVKQLSRLNHTPKSVLDFGCGIGSSTPYFQELLDVDFFLGIDSSSKCVEHARQKWGSDRIQFMSRDEYEAKEQFDLAFSNGVFHHIIPEDRPAALQVIKRALKPEAIFAFWENNPWNPGTRYVMHRLPFDKNAQPLTAGNARRLLKTAGFEIIRTDFLFIFPRLLRALRPIESSLARLPMGGQYQILCRR